MKFFGSECSHTTPQLAITTNLPCHKERTGVNVCVCVCCDIKLGDRQREGSLFIILEAFEERVSGDVMVVGQMSDENVKAVATHFRTHN